MVAAAARKLPGVEDSTSYGTPSVKVRGKMIARLHEDGDTVVLCSDFIDRQILMQSDPDAFFITDHYRNYPLVLMRLAKVPQSDLPDLLERAWQRLAPKRLIAEYAAAHKP